MVVAALLTAIAVGCLIAAHLLLSARWPSRGPHVAVVAWQALGLAWGVSTIGALLAFGLAPYGLGVLHGLTALVRDAAANGLRLDVLSEGHFAATRVAALVAAVLLTLVLFWGLAVSFLQVVRTRRRHRALLELVAHEHPEVPGARVLDHPAAAAYCLPGVLNPQIVISAGALEVLDRRELAAVLAHEHAHLRQRHDLVLLPFSSLKRAFPRVRIMERCYNAVALLIEMCADDHARRHHSPRELATALVRFGAAGGAAVPAGAMAVVPNEQQPEVLARVSRLLNPVQLSRRATAAVLSGSVALMASTLTLWHLPM
ncbi:M56 family metallopeptidase [Thermobifida cellulosilytica]|uniref:Peptidase M48 Ste24p n=1 Tax=Thermobifida cellulosilytica TB100 TaxID=665004 RepID=A0A147KDR0_THECS|nr:M56 family metallopeptidase [Thermobifida cellulosilytica]KUP95410.1 peptidase M48 Ste24p [Thermobifida cellulosilytica TB100]